MKKKITPNCGFEPLYWQVSKPLDQLYVYVLMRFYFPIHFNSLATMWRLNYGKFAWHKSINCSQKNCDAPSQAKANSSSLERVAHRTHKAKLELALEFNLIRNVNQMENSKVAYSLTKTKNLTQGFSGPFQRYFLVLKKKKKIFPQKR